MLYCAQLAVLNIAPTHWSRGFY